MEIYPFATWFQVKTENAFELQNAQHVFVTGKNGKEIHASMYTQPYALKGLKKGINGKENNKTYDKTFGLKTQQKRRQCLCLTEKKGKCLVIQFSHE